MNEITLREVCLLCGVSRRAVQGYEEAGLVSATCRNKRGYLLYDSNSLGFGTAMLFGIIFSLGWTPCVGAFLGSALMLASQQAHAFEGMLMLLAYSLGLGIPFIISAVLIDYLKSAFDWIKRNYRVINLISGVVLIVIGIFMATGTLGRLLRILS